MSGTMAEKVWRDHIVSKGENGAPDLLYIDLHLVHEVTSPQAFEGLRLAGRKVRRPDLTMSISKASGFASATYFPSIFSSRRRHTRW